ncbi:unnamed protein product [Calypogeia fissa]
MNAEVGAVFLQKAARYLLIKGVLHKHGADGHTRRCLEGDKITRVMEALHDGEAGGHYGAHNTVRKILDAGYWWPTLHKDVYTFIVAKYKHDWDVKLFSAVYSYNLAYKSPTGQTPYFLVFGQTALVPIEFDIQTPRVSIVEREPERLSLAERAIQIEALEEARLIASVRVEHQ